MARPGNVGLVSQSGALLTAILDWSLRANVGFSRFVSIGSMLDVNWGDLIEDGGEQRAALADQAHIAWPCHGAGERGVEPVKRVHHAQAGRPMTRIRPRLAASKTRRSARRSGSDLLEAGRDDDRPLTPRLGTPADDLRHRRRRRGDHGEVGARAARRRPGTPAPRAVRAVRVDGIDRAPERAAQEVPEERPPGSPAAPKPQRPPRSSARRSHPAVAAVRRVVGLSGRRGNGAGPRRPVAPQARGGWRVEGSDSLPPSPCPTFSSTVQLISSSRVESSGFRRALGDDFQEAPISRNGAVIEQLIGDRELRSLDHLAAGVSGVHRGVEDAGGQEGAFERVRRVAVLEVPLDRVGEGLEQVAIVPGADVKTRGQRFFLARRPCRRSTSACRSTPARSMVPFRPSR